MENKTEIERNQKRIHYQKPLFEKQVKMTFPTDVMEKFNGGRFCLQCSGCHGCR